MNLHFLHATFPQLFFFPEITHANNEILGRGLTSHEETWGALPREELGEQDRWQQL